MLTNQKTTGRLANSDMIFVVALALTVAGFDVFKKPTLDVSFWISLCGMALLVLSIIFRGWGVARIHEPSGLFNGQALCCLFGFLLLAGGSISRGISADNNIVISIAGLPNESGEIGRIVQLLDSNCIEYTKQLNDIHKRLKTVEEVQKTIGGELPDK